MPKDGGSATVGNKRELDQVARDEAWIKLEFEYELYVGFIRIMVTHKRNRLTPPQIDSSRKAG